MTKQCSKCKEEKEYSEFYKGKGEDGYRSNCKSCVLTDNKKWRDDNKDKVYISSRKWISKNPEKVKNYQSNYRKKESRKNYLSEYLNKYNKEYYENNKEYLKNKNKEYRKEWYNKNKNYYKKYFIENKEKINENRRSDKNRCKVNEYKKRRRKENYIYLLYHNIGCSLRNAIKRNGFTKNSKTIEILGCTFEEFKTHIESKFENWMNWENYGKYNGEFNYGWDIDHIIPLSTSNNIEDILNLYYYTNLQPLCSKINRDIKRDILIAF